MHTHTQQLGEEDHAHLTADVVAIANPADPHVLLIRRGHDPFAGQLALPGGYLNRDERAEHAAARELAEETGLHIHADRLTRIGTFDAPGRDPRARVVSAAFLATLPAEVAVVGDDDATDARWHRLTHVRAYGLAFDHADIITTAITVVMNAGDLPRTSRTANLEG